MPLFLLIFIFFTTSVESNRCNYNNEHSYKIHNHLSALLYTRFSFNKYQQYLYAFCDTLKIFLRIKPYIYEIQPENSENLISSPFEPGNPTKVIIHGYLSSCDDDVFNVIKEAYLDAGEYNIVCFDWSYLASGSYFKAVDSLQLAGVTLARILDWLIYMTGSDPSKDFHLVGHSLGAHVAGIAGLSLCHGILWRITALDPAVPYITLSLGTSLDISNAYYIETIFTSALATGHPLTHANYFINGGASQPECDNYTSYYDIIICNHARAYTFYADVVSLKNTYTFNSCLDESSAIHELCYENLGILSFDKLYLPQGIFSVSTK